MVEEKDMKVEKVPEDAEGKKFLFRQLASYFTMVLTEWESALEKEKRDTFASKAAYNAMVQSKENMTPVSHKSLATSFQELTYHSCFESLRRAMWTKGFWNPLWRLSKQLKNDDTWMLTMGIYV
jgi:hypothetical protein